MTEGAKSLLMWENNPDTPINASNLSKTINLISESKFIYYEDSLEGYEKWADIVIESELWPAEGIGQAGYSSMGNYIGKIVYNTYDKLVKMGIKSDDDIPIYSWSENLVSPYKKTLKLLPFTKIGTKFLNTQDEIQYSNFDSGSEWQVFSIDSLLVGSDFYANTIYNIYIYHYTTYGDCSKIKIVSDFDESNGEYGTDNWKRGTVDESSPTGYRVISYKKVGGFKTDINKYIIESSIWDISIKNTQIISESYNIIDNNEIRDFQAKDLPIKDESAIFNSVNVEKALEESKLLIDSVRDDVYFSDTRFGVDLKFSQIKEVGSTLSQIVEKQDEITLKITAGYIDVLGTRVKIEEDIYLASTNLDIKINEGNFANPIDDAVPRRQLGQIAEHTIYEGIWRVFINISGKISFIEKSVEVATYRPVLRGWYNNNGERCIGKFKVVHSATHYYIQKMSVTGTYDEKAPVNTMFMFHGTMCPDGLIPCDGEWHDVNGLDPEGLQVMPEVTSSSDWQSGSWYEDTPNMWNRTVKMVEEQVLPFDTIEFSVDYDTNIITGSSDDCGQENDLSTANHSHDYEHYHESGTLSVPTSGGHVHNPDEFFFSGDATTSRFVADVATGIEVPRMDHQHIIGISTSGEHNHSSLIGRTYFGDHNNTDETSSWSPYKEILFCIRK